MAWAVTLKVTDCSTNANLSNAFITDGNTTGYTDSYGQYICVINDYWSDYILDVGKSGYTTKKVHLSRATMNGTTQNVCLDKKPPPTGGDGSGGGW